MSAFIWARYHEDGYEVSSRGDQRFSPLFARMPDGRSIEAHYQCDVKGFEPGGVNWRQYKGRAAPGKTRAELWEGFLGLWRTWAAANRGLMLVLSRDAKSGVLTDRFATTEINQAHALSTILNDWAEA